jgi:hypothetical protein
MNILEILMIAVGLAMIHIPAPLREIMLLRFTYLEIKL